MGLDGVELIMGIEERFGIAIPDSAVNGLKTPRELYEYVIEKVGAKDDGSCVSQATFHRVRRVLAKRGLAVRSRARPGGGLEALLPRSGRRRWWPPAAAELGVSRSLRRSRWFELGIAVFGVLVFLLVLPQSTAVVAAASAVLGVLLAVVLTTPVAVHFRGTVADLTRSAMGATARRAAEDGRAIRWTRREVVRECREIIRDQLGLVDFSDDADFADELGLV